MNNPQPQKLFSTNNELAKERNRAAAERTINAWIGNSLSLIGIGVAIDQIFRSLQRRFPDASPQVTETAAHVTSLAFIGVGLALLAIALTQHRLEIKTIERADYVALSVSALNRLVVAGIVLIGVAGFFAVLYLQ